MKKLSVFIGGSTVLDFTKDNNGLFNNQLLDVFSRYGFVFAKIQNADCLICINHSRKHLNLFLKLNRNKENTVLIRTEPIAVLPAQYTKQIENRYGLVITVGRKETNRGKFYDVSHPYSYLPNPNFQMTRGKDLRKILESKDFNELFNAQNWVKRPLTLSLIASNKVSSTSKSNYRLRRDLAKRARPSLLKVYGSLWGAGLREKLKHRLSVFIFSFRTGYFPNFVTIYGKYFQSYPCFVDQIADKHQIVKQSKFSLIIENSNDYISEKLFDALINGSIPLYYGPNLEKMGLPGKLIAIEFDGTVKGLEKQIMSISNKDIFLYLKSIKNFLNSSSFFDTWSAEIVYDKISERIKAFLIK